MNIMGVKKLFQGSLLALLMAIPVLVSAQDIMVCPQIFPECDKDGNVATSFAQAGEPCFAYYQAQCYAARIQELEAQLSQCKQSVSQCQQTSSLQEETVLKFKRKIRRMKRRRKQ